ncbi:hypothetical protein BK120_23365 [Paenibacillus sp. FSL A5-0031]|uniref:hypothetical protein n=1 Tax=Paenibacillus sp. FSL A5-0031 TaxID=1920420 RepID=UPI00096F336E|nr:hypothetical protein [Paenibacillus sp. FSL A5-0031]OME78681.1 hypothetical protein BK120_23365 [Paenibacillus sp. FSL A5-0031]
MGAKGFNNIDDDTKAKINNAISASGLTDKEWIDRATDVWLQHEMKSTFPEHRLEIEEVESLTNRIRGVVVNLAERTHFDRKDIQQNHADALEELNLQISKQNLEIQAAARDLKAAQEVVLRERELRIESEKYAQKAQETSDTNKQLVESYREKNDTLTGLVNQYKEGYEASNQLRIELTAAGQRINELERELKTEQIARASAEKGHEDEIQRVSDRKDLENEREVLRMRTELQNQLTESSTRGAAEIRELYERLETQRKEYELLLQDSRRSISTEADSSPSS